MQALQAKQVHGGPGHAGRVLYQLVVAFLAAVARAIRHRQAKHRAKMPAADLISTASTRNVAGANGNSSS